MNDKSKLQSRNSIKNRLIIFYSAAVFVLLTMFALFLYWVTINILYKADYEFLSDQVDTIQYIMKNKSYDKTALQNAVITTPTNQNDSIYRYYVRITNIDGKIISETPNDINIFNNINQMHTIAENMNKKRYYWFSKNGNDYLLIQSPITIRNRSNSGVIEVALDLSFQHNVLSDRKKFVSFIFAAILVSLCLGWIIARRGLRSLELLSETVQKITTSSLDQRIDPNSWPQEVRSLGKAFNQMLDRIEASFLRLKQFSADLSHELRTPITNLIGETEVALSYPHSSNEYRSVLESNLEEMQRISSLIENILFLARAENPQNEIKKSTLSITDEIALVCEFYRAMAEDKNIELSYTGNAKIKANPDMFRRMISNLLSNALKYTPIGGKIHFETHIDGADEVSIKISDNGIGIAKNDLKKIFDRFYRVDAARTRSSGSGLGLSIVKSIVDMHHGSIQVESVENIGTTVTIKLPQQ